MHAFRVVVVGLQLCRRLDGMAVSQLFEELRGDREIERDVVLTESSQRKAQATRYEGYSYYGGTRHLSSSERFKKPATASRFTRMKRDSVEAEIPVDSSGLVYITVWGGKQGHLWGSGSV